MTTSAEASEVLTLISLLHRRTAPVPNDREAAKAIATLWAEVFSAHNLALSDLIAGVKLRAQHFPDAPEPADVIEFARKVRKDRPLTDAERDRLEAIAESKSEDAEELRARREYRAIAPKVERPALPELMGNVGKPVPGAE